MNFDLKVTGAFELGARAVGLGREMAKEGPLHPLERGVLAGGKLIADEAAREAPKDTGEGAASIATRIVESKDGRVVGEIGPGHNQYYMIFHEIGTSKMDANPFLTPALDSMEKQAINATRDVWRRAIHDYARRGGREA